jgi:hypothetical protein
MSLAQPVRSFTQPHTRHRTDRDFEDKQLGYVNPYGVYDLAVDRRWVGVAIISDTAEFAVNEITLWWEHLGRERYPHARTLTMTAASARSSGATTATPRNTTGLQNPVYRSRQGLRAGRISSITCLAFVGLDPARQTAGELEAIVSLMAATKTKSG